MPKEQLMDVLAEVDCRERGGEERERGKGKRKREEAKEREEGIRISICSLTTKAEVYCM